MSADLCSDALKKKKHYNTFRPGLGFFLPYSDVMEWFDATPSYYDMVSNFLDPDSLRVSSCQDARIPTVHVQALDRRAVAMLQVRPGV